MQEIFLGFIFALIKIIFAIILSCFALYSGISLLDRLTSGINEWEQIKKGNLAIGLFYASVMLSIFLVVLPGILDFISYIYPFFSFQLIATLLFFAFINFLIRLFVGIGVIYLVIHIIDKITPDIDELIELEKGNLAVSLIFSIVILSVVFATIGPIDSLLSVVESLEQI